MKSTIINTRVSENLKDDLNNYAFVNDISASNIVRDAISEFIHKPKISNVDKLNVEMKNMNFSMSQMLDFTKLINWVQESRHVHMAGDQTEFYLQSIKLIKEIKNNPLFSPEIIIELNKVSTTFDKILTGQICDNPYKYIKEHENGFDYDQIFNFLNRLMYCNELQQLVFNK
ncbi:hypothetical protein A9Q87_04560 [Flavobacteriales bacterium 34_180_T64]|nr:hypothetical protein A9Q87_04560 [Flavobacteriales bacterium 34_180_T64]